MKNAISVILAVALSVAAYGAPEGEKYTTKYDNVDLKEILKNDRLFNSYYKCVMGKGTCSPDGQLLRDSIPDALTNNCSKCSEKQKAGAEEIIKFMMENKKAEYAELENKFDHDGVYRKKYEATLEE